MTAQTTQWEVADDRRAVFLRCYSLMTHNMLAAVQAGEFSDGPWVSRLLERFAEYYFMALQAYEEDPASTPAVWQLAHQAALTGHGLALNQLLLGVNAHINYDLVLCLADLLEEEWLSLSVEQRAQRYRDHCHVNAVIARTIDRVQDELLEPGTPLLSLLDLLLGPADEQMISRVITHWRDEVWQRAAALLDAEDSTERAYLIRETERAALGIAHYLG